MATNQSPVTVNTGLPRLQPVTAEAPERSRRA